MEFQWVSRRSENRTDAETLQSSVSLAERRPEGQGGTSVDMFLGDPQTAAP